MDSDYLLRVFIILLLAFLAGMLNQINLNKELRKKRELLRIAQLLELIGPNNSSWRSIRTIEKRTNNAWLTKG